MTDIKDLELRIKSSESTLEMLRGELEELRQQQQPEPEQESLLGRWATHPKYGRGIITDVEPNADGEVEFAFPDKEDWDTRTTSVMIEVDELTLDPATLSTTEDFDKAPMFTIVENIKEPRDVYMKHVHVWDVIGDDRSTLIEEMPPCRVIRWGSGK